MARLALKDPNRNVFALHPVCSWLFQRRRYLTEQLDIIAVRKIEEIPYGHLSSELSSLPFPRISVNRHYRSFP